MWSLLQQSRTECSDRAGRAGRLHQCAERVNVVERRHLQRIGAGRRQEDICRPQRLDKQPGTPTREVTATRRMTPTNRLEDVVEFGSDDRRAIERDPSQYVLW